MQNSVCVLISTEASLCLLLRNRPSVRDLFAGAWVDVAASRIRSFGAGRALRGPTATARREVPDFARSTSLDSRRLLARSGVTGRPPSHGFALHSRQPNRHGEDQGEPWRRHAIAIAGRR